MCVVNIGDCVCVLLTLETVCVVNIGDCVCC